MTAPAVLICDDHALFAESLALVLAGAGYEITAVTHSPDEALAVLASTTVDICVFDVGFGTTSVVGRLRDLRAAAGQAHLVLLSGNLDEATIRAGLAAGVRGFACKNGHIAEITGALGRVAGGELVTGTAVAPARVATPVALTPREREVLGYLAQAEDTKALARMLGVGWATARSHVRSVLTKLGAHTRLEAVTVAVRSGLIDPDIGEYRPARATARERTHV
ncbi:response regulator transcription factor [Longispora albida]|uniref:response regulator transcription factor n=1 Tax=Longispora albida TaxID=203523 RepID=UPI00036C5335|nr:response regulator transcription factor [Longispora albida]